MKHNIAIDGPAGAGKSTIAKLIAKKLGYIYVDTGAMYRAMALYLLRCGIKEGETDKIGEACQDARITISYSGGEQQVLLNGENVNGLIRTEEVGNMASSSSAVLSVRKKLVELQKELAGQSDVVMDGRDIGTCVLPDADCKIYLSADASVRAKRRYDELSQKGIPSDLSKIQEDIEERDRRDMTRENSPLVKAEDAVFLDSSHMTIEEVAEKVIGLIKAKESK